MRLAGHRMIVLLSALIVRPALAQDPEQTEGDTTGAEEASDTIPEPPPRAVPWADAYQWRSMEFRRPARALATNSRGQLMVLDEDGAVYVQEGRAFWAETLGGDLTLDLDINEEDLLLDAEAAVEDFTDVSNEPSDPNDTSVDVDEDEVSEVDPADISDAVDIGIQDADDRFGGQQRPPESIWASQSVPGLVLVSRDDGAFRSTNDGRTWREVEGLPPTYDFLELKREGVILAATPSGIFVSDDRGQTWREGDPAMRGVQVFDLELDGALLYAATADGLWQSIGGRMWGKLLPPRYADLGFFDIALDSDWTGGIWAATAEEGVIRSDDAGQTFRPSGRNPLIGTTEFAPIYDAPGHLLAAGSDGVWESTDGGVRWVPLADGLPGPIVNDVLVEGAERPVIATPGGVFQLKRPELISTEQDSGAQLGMPVDTAVQIALRRAGISQEPFDVQRRFTRALLTPRLRMQAEYQPDEFINLDYDAISSSRFVEEDWKFNLDLCFGACSVSSSLITDEVGALDNLELAVIGDEVFQTDGAISAVAPAAANVVQRLSQYRGDVAGLVTELYFTRQRMLGEQASVPGLPLSEQVLFELEMQEIVARLDIYTDGKFSSSLQNP